LRWESQTGDWFVRTEKKVLSGSIRAPPGEIHVVAEHVNAQCRAALARAAVGAIVKSDRINTIVYGFHVESA
jgi:hypothetical protein